MDIDFADLFTHLPSPYMILDRELRFQDANQAYLAVTGSRREEIIGRFVFDVFPETQNRRQMFEDAFRRALAGEANALVRQRFDLPRSADDGGGARQMIWNTHQIPVRDSSGAIVGVLQKALDVSSEVLAEQTRDAVLREFDHRIKNLLAKVSAISELTAREETELGTYLAKLRERLGSLARTQSVLLAANHEASIAELLEAELAPFGAVGEAAAIEGPRVAVSGAAAQTLGMAFHELSTNAAKYGALFHAGASLRVGWALGEDAILTLDWIEDGFAASQPDRRGFGTTIIERLVPMDLGGKVERWFDGDGHRVRFMLPVDGLTAERSSKPG